MKRLPDTELEVMKALWATGPDTPRALLEERLALFGWAANTINTYLARLADKGFVAVRREGKSNLYTPLVSCEEYQAFDSRAVLERLYGSPGTLWPPWPGTGWAGPSWRNCAPFWTS